MSTAGTTSVQLSLDSDPRLDDLGIFRWYRYTQDFHPDFVSDWIYRVSPDCKVVCDPFVGSGTTLLVAGLLGLTGVGTEINPFMRLVCRAKTAWGIEPEAVSRAAEHVLEAVTTDEHRTTAESIFEADPLLRKWINPEPASDVVALHSTILSIAEGELREILLLALARDLLEVSNMTLRPNICYRSTPNGNDGDVRRLFQASVNQMVRDLFQLSAICPAVLDRFILAEDARTFSLPRGIGPADLVITSPPYPNDMEYVHQTRLELAFLGFARGRNELLDLKREMISSSVKLVYRANAYQEDLALESPRARKTIEQLDEVRNKSWGWNPAKMAAHYFGGMRLALRRVRGALRLGGYCLLVVGDSAFNGVLIPTDAVLAELAEVEGLRLEGVEVFRPRFNTKHRAELGEMVVVLRNR